MVDKEDLLKQADDIHSGLKRLSLKNRKVVMPHHKEFELIEELEELSLLNVDRLGFTIWPQDPDAVLLELEGLTDIVDSFVS